MSYLPNKPYSVQDLEEERVFNGCEPEDTLEIFPDCHQQAKMNVFYYGGILHIGCSACRKIIVKIAVAMGPMED